MQMTHLWPSSGKWRFTVSFTPPVSLITAPHLLWTARYIIDNQRALKPGGATHSPVLVHACLYIMHGAVCSSTSLWIIHVLKWGFLWVVCKYFLIHSILFMVFFISQTFRHDWYLSMNFFRFFFTLNYIPDSKESLKFSHWRSGALQNDNCKRMKTRVLL